MQASKVTFETLHAAAIEIGVTLDTSTLNARGTRHRVKLLPLTHDGLYRPACKSCRNNGRADRCHCRRNPGAAGDAKYQRTSAAVMFREDRRVHAVCWHGFRDFFRAVYRREPLAVFATAMDTWRGSADFEARFRNSGHKNIGSQVAPVCAAEACRCPESGTTGSCEYHEADTQPMDSYGADEADGAACRAMAAALRATRKEVA